MNDAVTIQRVSKRRVAACEAGLAGGDKVFEVVYYKGAEFPETRP